MELYFVYLLQLDEVATDSTNSELILWIKKLGVGYSDIPVDIHLSNQNVHCNLCENKSLKKILRFVPASSLL